MSMSGSTQLIQREQQPTLVVKTGGSLVDSAEFVASMCSDIAELADDYSFIIVNGGGREIDRLCASLSVPVEKVEGLRVTPHEVLDIVQMALAKSSNRVACSLSAAGLKAVPMPAFSGGLVNAERRTAGGRDIGYVGRPVSVDPSVLQTLLAGGFTPVIYPLSSGAGQQLFNVNADEVSSAIAAATGSEALMLMTDVDGVVVEGRALPVLSAGEVAGGSLSSSISGGMLPKIGAAVRAAESGVRRVCIMDGRRRGSISGYLRKGIANGTEIRK